MWCADGAGAGAWAYAWRETKSGRGWARVCAQQPWEAATGPIRRGNGARETDGVGRSQTVGSKFLAGRLLSLPSSSVATARTPGSAAPRPRFFLAKMLNSLSRLRAARSLHAIRPFACTRALSLSAPRREDSISSQFQHIQTQPTAGKDGTSASELARRLSQAVLPKLERPVIKKVCIVGSGGLSIGQAGEFDYSGQSCAPHPCISLCEPLVSLAVGKSLSAPSGVSNILFWRSSGR